MTTRPEEVHYRLLHTTCDVAGCQACEVSDPLHLPGKLRVVRDEWHDHLRPLGWTIDIIEHRCPTHSEKL